MGRKFEARRIRVDGQVMIAIPEKEYAILLAGRRQVGAQGARIRVLQHALGHALARLAAAQPHTSPVAGPPLPGGSSASDGASPPATGET
ncbi:MULTISPECIES: hypothetical protein [unclassified Kitasatospora]|uniref:hypothetical protein n=1 Tax=unclassified Kitasatospora TaxID=2633591 RepID=UPI003826D7AA